MARSSSNAVSYTCYQCGKTLKLPASRINTGVKCPKCGALITDDPPAKPKADVDEPRDRGVSRKVSSSRRSATATSSSRQRPEPEPAPDRSADLDEAPDLDEPLDEPSAEDSPAEEEQGLSTSGPSSSSRASERRGAGAGVSRRREGGERGGDVVQARGRARAGVAACERIAGLAPLLGILLLIACGAIAGYYIAQGPAAVMAETPKEAMFNAVFFGCLGVIGFVVLFTCGKLAAALASTNELLGDLREQLRGE